LMSFTVPSLPQSKRRLDKRQSSNVQDRLPA
jgi:hypothetical protein